MGGTTSSKKLFLSSSVLFVLFSLSLIVMVGAEPSWVVWSQTYGGTGEEGMAANGVHLVRTSDGGFALAGGTYSFGAGGVDFWLVKTDANGNMEWNRTYGGADHDIPHSLIQTADGGFALCGETRLNLGHPDFWLVKTDANGNMEWNQTYGGISIDRANSLIQTSDGGYALAGGTLSFGAGEWDFWLVKTDEDGDMEWNMMYGGADVDTAFSLVETSDGGYALAGETKSFPAGDFDFWLVKTDVSGNMEWNRTYGGANNDFANSVVQTSDGGYTIAGDTLSFGAGDYDFWLIKTNEQGVPEFPSWIILPLFFVTTLIVIVCKKRLPKNPSNI
jgi:hypothetical protein